MSDPGERVLRRVLEFCELLRGRGFEVTPGRLIDATRALQLVGLGDRDEFRLALRLNLVSSAEQQELFDRLFDIFWRAQTRLPPPSEPLDAELRRGGPGTEERSDKGAPAQYGVAERQVVKDLAAHWPGPSRQFDRAVRGLARKLATRPSRRFTSARRGPQVDVRRSLRQNARHGMDIVELVRRRRKIRKTRIVVLCDVSGSMDEYTPFLLELLFTLQKRVPGSRTAVFSTRMTEVTRALRRHPIEKTLADVAELALHWSGGTDLGAALAGLNRTLVAQSAARSTVAVIVSDGYDQGEPARVRLEMERLAKRTRTIVWVNPLLGTEGYEPLARGMRAALPYVDHFLPARDAESLLGLVRRLRAA